MKTTGKEDNMKTTQWLIAIALVVGSVQLHADNKKKPGPPAIDAKKIVAMQAKSFALPDGIKMVHIPAGTFTMGSPKGESHRFSDETQRTVSITKPLYMSAFEVTQQQFYDLMLPDFDFDSWTYFRGPIPDGTAYHFRTRGGGPGKGVDLLLDNPMECVSWPRALKYCNLVNTR
jgi:formylglycine-generating enzyme required for sulfatase activity